MTPKEREFIAKLCATRAGLRVPLDQPYLMDSRLGPIARREGFGSIPELVQAIRDRADERHIWATVEAMALCETSFFRDREVFHDLWRTALPQIAQRRAGGTVRIWSAGCASGQEVYSLAMMLEEEERPAGVRIELFGSDLSDRLLEKAQSGLYSQFEVQRGLSARQLVRHFEKREEAFALSRRVRQHVRWRRVNLIEDLSRLGQYDVILCRNVLGSLLEPVRAKVVQGLAEALAPGGLLVLGLGEQASVGGLQPSGLLRGGFCAQVQGQAAA